MMFFFFFLYIHEFRSTALTWFNLRFVVVESNRGLKAVCG